MKYSPQLLNATFLVAGTCIGGGMLALPVATAQTGFIPSTFMMFIAWLAMTCTSLCLIEVGFWMKKDDAHIISMTSNLLGPLGKWISWVLYLFICYASIIAYTAAGGHLMAKAITQLGAVTISNTAGCWLFILLAGPSLLFSHKLLGKINGYFFIAMVITYFFIIALALPKVEGNLLWRQDWTSAWIALPLLLTSFSIQTMVPSLHPFLQHHAPSLRIAVIAGTSIAFLIYLMWQCAVLGTVPVEGHQGLLAALEKGDAATHYLGIHVGSLWIEWTASAFAFLALVTSFFGMSLGLHDFLADGLKIPKVGKGRLLLAAIILAPTLVCAISYERIFLLALDSSGAFGDAILNGIIPVLMVWVGRYIIKKAKSQYVLPGKKSSLLTILFFYVAVVILAILMYSGCIPSMITV